MPAMPTSPAARRKTPTEANAGRVAGVFGLRGELKVAPSRIGAAALRPGVELRAALRDGTSRTVRVRSLRLHQGRPLVAFDAVDDATTAAAFVGATLTIARGEVELDADEYFDDDLVGCALVDERGALLGEVVGVEHYPAQDVLVVALPLSASKGQDDKRAMVPLVRAFVNDVDVRAKRIHVALPPGLLDSREAEEA
jgi:16S rRNA processing protein RimM